MIKKPNVNISKHEIFVEYQKKLKYKNEIEFFEKVFQVEKEKIAYFILAYNQKLVLVKS
jgi:type I restriction enzyme M protein